MPHSKSFLKLCTTYGVDANNIPVEVTTFEKACNLQGLDPKKLPGVSRLPKRHQKRIIADYKLTIIAEAIKDGKHANYTDGSWKYWPVFEVKADDKRPSGFGLSYDDFDDWHSHTSVGVRLCFPNRDQAIFFGKHFLKLHIDHHLLT
jgi:hypothetical protein